MSKVNTILFDWDGTLAQTLEVWLKTFKEAYAAVNVYPEDKAIGSYFGDWQAHLKLGVKPEDEEEYKRHLEVAYERLRSVKLYQNAREVLLNLKTKDFKLGLVSTSNRKMLDPALEAHKLSDFFDTIVSAEDTTNHKPDPEPLLTALSRLNSNTATTIFVGDSNKAGAAANAKIPLFLFAPDSHVIYYDLSELRRASSVKATFCSWQDFPFEKIN